MHLHFTWSPPCLLASLPLCRITVWQVRTSFGAILHRLGAFQASPLPRFFFLFFLFAYAEKVGVAKDCGRRLQAMAIYSCNQINCGHAHLQR